jgi:hypothetical protein
VLRLIIIRREKYKMKAIQNQYKILYYDIEGVTDYLKTGSNLHKVFVHASSDDKAMRVVMDKYNIPMNWIVSSSINRMGIR